MDNFGNFGEPNNSFDGTDLNYSPEGVQASVDSAPAEQIRPSFAESEAAFQSRPIPVPENEETPLEKDYETELTEFQRFNTEMKDGLAEKYPHVFKSLTLPNGKNVQIQRVDTEETTATAPLYGTKGYDYLILTEEGVLKVSNLSTKDFQNLDGKMIEHMVSKKKTEPLSEQLLASVEKGNKKIRMPWEKHAPSDIDFLRRIPKSVLDQEFFTYFGANKDNLYNDEILNRKKAFKTALQTNEKIFAEIDKKKEIELMQKARNQDPQNLLDQL